MHPALFWEKLPDNKIKCGLCNHFCVITEGKTGICAARVNKEGKLYSLVYGRLIAEHVDPIEKKPFYHFLPGSLAYSVATPGCNFSCVFCQNAEISQTPREQGVPEGIPATRPERIVEKAKRQGCRSISYTYTEPTIFFEFAYDTARIARENSLKNNFVTNGYMSPEALQHISAYLDAANVDLKGDEGFYRKLCKAKQKPVVENIRRMRELGIWVEVTTLIIPEENDSEAVLEELARTVKGISADIPWHLSRFFPMYRMSGHYATPVSTVKKAREIGLKAGLKYVYTGNIPGDDGESTFCPKCGQALIKRYGYTILENHLKGRTCGFCSEPIPGVF